jgi:hypothetical protein
MSIAGILSSSFSQNQLSATSPYKQDAQKLSQDLQTGDLSAAQSDFATLQQAFSQSPASSASASPAATTTLATSNPVAQAFNQVASDLQSGNLTAAQKDLSAIAGSSGNQPSNGLRHHIHGMGGKNSNLQASLLQDLSQSSTDTSSSSPASAQQAYATMQQELQQFALGGGALASQANTLLESPISVEA